MTKEWTFYSFEGEKRKKVRRTIEESIKNRKQQILFLNKHFLEPQWKIVKLGNDVLKGKLPIEFYLRENERFADYIKKVLRW